METVLYEYSFDFLEYLTNLIPLIVGIGFFFFIFWHYKSAKKR